MVKQKINCSEGVPTFLVVLIIALFGLQVFVNTLYMEEISENTRDVDILVKVIERFEMYDKKIENKTKTNGVYFKGKDYYCVWTKDRSVNDINRTDLHESCHDFIYKDYSHFCDINKG